MFKQNCEKIWWRLIDMVKKIDKIVCILFIINYNIIMVKIISENYSAFNRLGFSTEDIEQFLTVIYGCYINLKILII